MSEKGPVQSLDFRKDLSGKLFARISAGESCTIVGASSMGKTRMINFLHQSNAQAKYLKEKAENLFVWYVNCNKVPEVTDWGLYQVMLNAVVNISLDSPAVSPRSYDEFANFRNSVVVSRDAYHGFSILETVVNTLIRREKLHVVVLFDDFHKLYPHISANALEYLRAIRDDHKNLFSYILFMRQLPVLLRDKKDHESFYELTSSIYVYGLTPYDNDEADRMINHLVERKKLTLSDHIKGKIRRYSGGHPGLIMALTGVAETGPEKFGLEERECILALLEEQPVREECERLWDSLLDVERESFLALIRKEAPNKTALDSLVLKGLVQKVGEEYIQKVILLFYAHINLIEGAEKSQEARQES